MDACNFPELLALDLETAESIFASKRMTAGAPRPMDVIFESKSIQDLTEARVHSNTDTHPYSSPRNFLPSKALAEVHAPADAMARLSGRRDHGRSKSTPHATPPSTEDQLSQLRPTTAAGVNGGPGGIFVISHSKQSSAVPRYSTTATNDTSEWDTDSVDSFELPNISLSRRGGLVQQQQQEEKQQHQQQQKEQQDQSTHREREPSFDEANHHLFLQASRYGDGSFRDSRDSYGSLYDSYDYTDDLNDSASVSSFSVSVPTAARGRQQSVVTAATSVTSSGCRFSSQSRTLSAMGPSSPVAAQRESVASCDRHVEFNLDNDIIDDTFRREDSSVAPSNRSSHNSQKSCGKVVSEDIENTGASHPLQQSTVATEEAEKDLQAASQQGTRPSSRGGVLQSSWMSFDDDDDDDEEADRSDGVRTNVAPSSKDDTAAASAVRNGSFSFYHGSIPQRPKTSLGVFDKEKTDFSELADWTSKKRLSQLPATSATPATTVPVPRRRSSLNHQVALETFDRSALLSQQYGQPKQGQSHRLRHFPPLSDAPVSGNGSSDVPPSKQPEADSSHFRRDLYATEKPTSPTTPAPAHTAATSREGEPPIFLQRTVYRKPIPEPLRLGAAAAPSPTKATRGQDWSKQDMAAGKGGVPPKDQTTQHRDDLPTRHNGIGRSNQRPFAEPLLISQFDDDDSESDHDEKIADNDANLFEDFEGAYNYDEGEDKIMLATMVPFSRQLPRSLRSRRSLLSLPEDAQDILAASSSAPPPMPGVDNAEETSMHLQSWIKHITKSQQELGKAPPAGELACDRQAYVAARERGAFYEEAESEEVKQTQLHETSHQGSETSPNVTSDQYQLQESLQQSQPVPYSFYQPGIVGIPLPREVVDTLRVSVSCFPETMLSLSSFSIQTIRSYSRKVRRCSQSDADSTYRLLMSPSSPTSLPPSPTSRTPFVPPLFPPSPTTASIHGGSFDLGPGVSRTMTGSTAASHSPRRFWKLPKKLVQSRTSPNLNLFTGSRSSGNDYPMSPTGAPAPIHSSGRRGSRPEEFLLSSAEEDQGKGTGVCFKRIFPTGSDYLCDALYAHIIAFNYVGLLCPPPAAATRSASAAQSSAEVRQPVTAAHTMTTSASTATLFDSAQQQKRQTIRIYVGSDVPLPSLSDFVSAESMSQGRVTPLSPTTMENNTLLLSPSSTPPPSRGRGDDDNRLISRKAALLLGMSETLEPDNYKNTAFSKSESSGGNSLVRRYNSLRRRRLRIGTSVSEAGAADSIAAKAAAASKMIKKAIPSSKPAVDISKPAYEADAISPSASATSYVPLAPSPAPTAMAADASMRDLHAGLHACISQLVATMKLTTGQLGNTLLNTEVAREIDPLFLRTLCELVRSQEEQL